MTRLLYPLRDRAVALLWGGMALSAIGDQAYAVALSWILVDAFGASASAIVALGPASTLLAALVIGRLADRWPPLRAMAGADMARAAVLLGVVGTWTLAGAPPLAGLVLAVVTLGVGQAVFRPALQSVLPGLVPDRSTLPAANALLDATERLARLLGPALAGLLAAVLPLHHLLTFDALTFLASAAALWGIGRVRAVPAMPHVGPPGGTAASLTRGWRVVRRHPLLGYVLATTGVLNAAWYAVFFVLLPLMVARGMGGPGNEGLAAYGLVISAYGCTNLVANLLVGSRPMPERPGRQIFAGNCCLGAGILLLAAVDAAAPGWALLPGYMLAAGVAAVGGPMQDIPVAVLRQTALPAPDVPAAMRAFMAVTQGVTLLALLALPAVAAALPVGAMVALCGGAILLVGAVGLHRFGAPSPPGRGLG